MRRPTGPEQGTTPAGAPIPASRLLVKMTLLNEVLSSPTWEGDDVRGQRRLSLHVEGSLVRCTLQVETPALRVSAVGRSIDDALAALEALLGSPDVPWEQDRYPLGVRAGRSRK